MIDYHRFCEIKHLHAHQGLTASDTPMAIKDIFKHLAETLS